jgi:ABC-type anion transport system duplicated permease subunit
MPPLEPLPQVRAGRTTLTQGLPAARRLILSAIVSLRRLIVPVVQPDMCGVITTFGNSWKGNFEGGVLGLPGEG